MRTLGIVVLAAWIGLAFFGLVAYPLWRLTRERVWGDPGTTLDAVATQVREESLAEALYALERYANTKDPYDWVEAGIHMRSASFAVEYDLGVDTHEQ